MATTSTIPAVKTALVNLIGTGLSGIQVTYGRPADDQLQRECVYLGDVTGTHTIPVFKAGRKTREERYEIDVVVWVSKPRGTLTAAEARGFVLLGAVEDVLANDPTLGGVDGLIHAMAGDAIDVKNDFNLEGPVSVILFHVHCLARLA